MTSYTPSQAAAALKVRRARIMAWIRSGELVASNLADGDTPRFRITEQALNDFLERRAVKPAAKRVVARRVTARTTENFFAAEAK